MSIGKGAFSRINPAESIENWKERNGEFYAYEEFKND